MNDPSVLRFFRQAMVARIATLSRSGRPSVTSLYFVYANRHLWLGTAEWTLAAREVQSNPRVSILLELEQNRNDPRVLQITGNATVRTEPSTINASNLRMALKYILTPGGLYNRLSHRGLLQVERRYHLQSSEKGAACIIDVTPEKAEFFHQD